MQHESEIEPIVTEVLAGRSERFAEIVRRYSRLLFNFVLNRVGNPGAASILTQDAFVEAHDRLPEYGSHEGPFQLWLYRIAFKGCLEWFRHGGRPLPESRPAIGGGTPSARAAARRRALEWLAGVDRADAQVLLMRYVDGLRDADIAFVTGLELSSVRSHIQRGVGALARRGDLEGAAGGGL